MRRTQHFCCVMIAPFGPDGDLPAGVHWATWHEIWERFGFNEYRRRILSGLKPALDSLKAAGCKVVYLDGSFVTSKLVPKDYDCCWDPGGMDLRNVDAMIRDTSPSARKKQIAKFGGEFFPSSIDESSSKKPFLEFFQTDREGKRKGIVAIWMEDFQ